MITTRHNTEARRLHYYDGGLFGPHLFYRWAVTPSGEKLPIYVLPQLTEGDGYVIQNVLLTDIPIEPYELPNLPNGTHDVWIQYSNDCLLWVPICKETLRVVNVEVYEPY